jgi:hypothetical protein
MPLYELTPSSILGIEQINFASAGIKERSDLQRVLREKIEIVAPGTLIISEEFGQWEDSRRRIDLLGVDQDANLVVIELKRTEDGGYMDLQSIRYAAMISTLTFERVLEIYEEHLINSNSEADPRDTLLEHLDWDSPEDGEFAPSVKVVLVSADFSKELTTSVLWLNEQGLDFRCVRMSPYLFNGKLLIDVQPLIPLPEASDYTVQIRAKRLEANRSRVAQQRDFSKFILTLDGKTTGALTKRRSMLAMIKHLTSKEVSPEEITAALPTGSRSGRFRVFEGQIRSENTAAAFESQKDGSPDYRRFFHEQEEIIYQDGKTYFLTKMWGASTQQCLEALIAAFSEHGISMEIVRSSV